MPFSSDASTGRLRTVRLEVAVELQPVAVRIAHVELAGAPSRVGDRSAVGQFAELVRRCAGSSTNPQSSATTSATVPTGSGSEQSGCALGFCSAHHDARALCRDAGAQVPRESRSEHDSINAALS